MTIKVLMAPHLDDIQGTSGVDRVIEMYFKYLLKYDIELVDKNATSYDLIAAHAGCRQDADVAHNHGMYWSADYKAADFELRTNANVIAGIRNAKQVTVPSHWVAEAFQRDMHFTPHIVHHGIEWEQWQHGNSNMGYVVGYNKNRNGVDVCDSSVAELLARGFPDIKFVNTFAHNNAPGNIFITGVVPPTDMKRVVQGCSVYVSTIRETGGIGILEAMAAGKPILGFAEGAILDLCRHRINSYLAQPGDIEDLKAGLSYCLKNRIALGKNGVKISEHFTWDRVAEMVAEIYRLAMADAAQTRALVVDPSLYELDGDT